MPQTIRAIETRYNGYRFRSRLEARWAVFFDTLGIPYTYEPEGFELDDGMRYLPDFWLSDLRCWVEIKPDMPSMIERAKARRLAEQSGRSVYLFAGNAWLPEWNAAGDHLNNSAFGWVPFSILRHDRPDESTIYEAENFAWCECAGCGEIGLWTPTPDQLHWSEYWTTVFSYDTGCYHRELNGRSSRIATAFDAARSARFEFGR